MTKVTKGNIVMVARDENQLAAFLNNGWKKIESVKQPDAKDEKPEEHHTNDDDTEPDAKDEKPRRGRKPAQKEE